MRNVYLLPFLLVNFYCCQSIAQNSDKSINLILTIDDHVVGGSISNFRIIASLDNGTTEVIKADYVPGDLKFSQSDFDRLMAQNVKTTFFAFDFAETCDGKSVTRAYEFDVKKGWLQHYYYIISLYNTDKKKYAGVFDPIPGKTYAFEFEFPGGATKLIRKKKLKSECN